MPDRMTKPEQATGSPRRFIAALVVFVLVLAVMVPGLLRLRAGGRPLLPSDAEVREHFQLRDPVVVLVETTHPDGIYNLRTLGLVQELSGALAKIDGVGEDQVASLATERRDRLFPGTLRFRPFLDPLPTTPLLMSLLESDVDAAGTLTGMLVSADRKATAVLAGVPAAGRAAAGREILRTAERFETSDNRISVAGVPVAESLLASRTPQIILACLLWAFAMAAAALLLLGRPGSPVTARRWGLLTALFLLAMLAGSGVGWLAVQDSWPGRLVRGSSFRQATERVNAQLHGSRILLAHVTFSPPAERIPSVRDRQGPLLDPAALGALGSLEAFIRDQPGVGGVVGPYANFTTVSYLWLGRPPEGRSVPDDPARIEHTFRMYDRMWGEFRRRQVVDDDLRRSVVTIFLKNDNYHDTRRLKDAIRGYEREHLGAHGARVDFAGDLAVSQTMVQAITRTQIWSLLLALAGLAILVPALLRRRAAGRSPAEIAVTGQEAAES